MMRRAVTGAPRIGRIRSDRLDLSFDLGDGLRVRRI